MHLIKRYDNRCLYDTELSANITTDDLHQYVVDGVEFKVVHAKTGEDITRQYLIQIILELESQENPFFTKDSLKQIIRFHGHPMQQWLQQYFEQSLSIMTGMQENTTKDSS